MLKKSIESAKLCNTLNEIPILESYLPKEITDDEIFNKLIPIFNTMNKSNIGELMKVAKEVLGKDFDGKRVSSLIKVL